MDIKSTTEELLTVKEAAAFIVSQEPAKKREKAKSGFNGLTLAEWALLSKNVIVEDDLLNPVWNDLSSLRNKYQLEHGAVYPVKLCER